MWNREDRQAAMCPDLRRLYAGLSARAQGSANQRKRFVEFEACVRAWSLEMF